MQNRGRLLFGITTFSHTELGLSEMHGLCDLGYACEVFDYGARKNFDSIPARAYIILLNSLKLLVKAYKFKPNYIYLNSRLDYKAPFRDFITILIIKLFYFNRVFFLIKLHGSELEVLQTRKIFYKKVVFPFLKRYVDGWLFLSNEELKWVVSNNLLNKNKLFLTKNIVRTAGTQNDPDFRDNFNIPLDHKILLFAGRMIKQKGVHDIIDAFENFSKKNKAILIMVGDGEEFENLKSRIEFLKIENLVRLPGWVDEEKVAYFTVNSDILIFPTYFPEGFSMALFNAVGAGLSIITTPIRAASDYLKEPENCLWVQPKSGKSIETALSLLFDNPNLMLEMKRNNKQLSLQFSKSQVAKELSFMLEAVKTNQS